MMYTSRMEILPTVGIWFHFWFIRACVMRDAILTSKLETSLQWLCYLLPVIMWDQWPCTFCWNSDNPVWWIISPLVLPPFPIPVHSKTVHHHPCPSPANPFCTVCVSLWTEKHIQKLLLWIQNFFCQMDKFPNCLMQNWHCLKLAMPGPTKPANVLKTCHCLVNWLVD